MDLSLKSNCFLKREKVHESNYSDTRSPTSGFRVKFSLFLTEFLGDLCIQDCSPNGIAFIQIGGGFNPKKPKKTQN